MENAERSVIFKLMAVADPASQAVLAAFGKQMEEAQARSLQATVTRSKAVVAIAAAESKAVVAAATDHVKKVEAIDSAAVAQKKYTMEELTAMEEAENAKRAEATRKMYEEQASWEKQHNDKKAKEEEAAAIKAAFKKADAVAAAERAAEAEAAKSAEKKDFGDRAQKAIAAEIQKGIDQRQAQREKEEAEVAKKAQREQEKLTKTYQVLQERSRTAAREVLNNFSEMSESAMRFARGLTTIGLVGEKDLDKVKDALLAVHGAFDVFSGITKIVTKADQVMQSLTKATVAQAAAQAVANRLAGGAAVSAGAGAAGSVVAGAAGGAVASGSGGMAGALVASLSNPVTALGAALVAAAGAAYLFYRNSKDDGKSKELNTVQEIGLYGGGTRRRLAQSQKDTDAAESRSKQILDMNKRDRDESHKIATEQSHALKEQLAIQESILHRKYEQADAAGKSRIIESEIAKYSKEVAKGDPAARGHVITWLEKRLSHEKEISRVARETATQSLKASKDQLKSIEDQIKARQQANMSARESFGLKSEEDQQEIISIKKRVDQGDQSVTGEELSKIKGLSGRTDKQIAAIAGKRASQAGFGMFQREEDTDINQLNSMKKKVEMEIKQKTDVVVKIDRDIEAEATNIAKKIMAQQAMQDQELAKRVAEMTKEMDVIKQRFFQRNHGGTL